MTAGDAPSLETAVHDALREVIDPELGINVVDLGLVYGISATDDGVRVEMTATSPACPMNEYLVAEARRCIGQRLGTGVPIEVRLVWDPPWTPERISPQARRLLGMEDAAR